jgi:hypothetical protein
LVVVKLRHRERDRQKREGGRERQQVNRQCKSLTWRDSILWN